MTRRLLDQDPDDNRPENWKPLVSEEQTPSEPPPAPWFTKLVPAPRSSPMAPMLGAAKWNPNLSSTTPD